MAGSKLYTGMELREMFSYSTKWLEKSAPAINALNVFPVPDGDTGINMLLTMRSAIEESYHCPDRSAQDIAQALARGALMGARGNSGVILSQIIGGLAFALEGKQLGGESFASGLAKGADRAYRALSSPVEGTILTVVREVAMAAKEAAASGDDLNFVLEAAVNAARDAVASTPSLLPQLQEAGVVDAGGQGLYTILEGFLLYVRGEVERMEYITPRMIAPDTPLSQKLPEEAYGYDTVFIIQGENLNPDKIRKGLQSKGSCLIVAGDERMVKVHIHTFKPGKVLEYALSRGTLHQIEIENMDDQAQDFARASQEKPPPSKVGVACVVSGEGFTKVFRSLGAGFIIPGGQTMNPKVGDIVEGVDALPQEEVIILPNNKNIILTADKAKELSVKKAVVIPTRTIPQGISALLAMSYEGDLETNIQKMEEAIGRVVTIELTRAVRSTTVGGLKIGKGKVIAIVDDKIVASEEDHAGALHKALSTLNVSAEGVITVYYGGKAEEDEAQMLEKEVQNWYPETQVELIYGGQPHYDYIISLE
jgi:hypothetical protein